MRVVGYVLLAVLGVLVLLLLAAVIRTLCMKKKNLGLYAAPGRRARAGVCGKALAHGSV